MTTTARAAGQSLALALTIAAPAAGAADAVTFDELLKLVRSQPDPAAVLDRCGDQVFTLGRAQRVQLLKAGAAPALVDALQRPRMALEDVRNFALILDCFGSMPEQLPEGRTKAMFRVRLLRQAQNREALMSCTSDAMRSRQYKRYAGGTFAGHIPIWQKKDAVEGDGSPCFFLSNLPGVDADGAPTAYGPPSIPERRLLEWMCNANRDSDCSHKHPRPRPEDPGATQNQWPGIVMNGPGRPATQGPGQPASGYYVSQTKLRDRSLRDDDQRKYVDATRYPYLALPPALFRHVGYVRLGDFAVVINVRTGRFCYAIYADTKTSHRLEGSIALAQALGINASARNGGTNDRILLCLLFPGSGFDQGYIPSLEVLRHSAMSLYTDDWGATLADCYGEYAGRISGADEVSTDPVGLRDLL